MAYTNGTGDCGVCILAKQVFTECYQKECKLYDMVDLMGGCRANIIDITFKNGEIKPPGVTLTPVPNKDDLFIAEFTVKIPYHVDYKFGVDKDACGEICIPKKIYLRIPASQVREEFEFEYCIETESQVIGEPFCEMNQGGGHRAEIEEAESSENRHCRGQWKFTVGTTIVIKVCGWVQLQVLTTGYCPVPCECEDVENGDSCEEFLNAPFPDDFFPPIPDDLCPTDE